MTKNFIPLVKNILSLLDEDNITEILPMITEGAKKHPEEETIWLYLSGLSMLRQNWPSQALAIFEKAHQRDPARAEIVDALLACANLLGRKGDMLYYAKLGLATKKSSLPNFYPDWMPAARDSFFKPTHQFHTTLAETYKKNGLFEKAANIERDYLLSNPKDRAFLTQHINTLLLCNRPFEASQLLEHILGQGNISRPEQKAMARVMCQTGQYDTAFELARELVINAEAENDKNYQRDVSFMLEMAISNPSLDRVEKIAHHEDARQFFKPDPLFTYDYKPRPDEEKTLRLGIIAADLESESVTSQAILFMAGFRNSNCWVYLYLDGEKRGDVSSWAEQFVHYLRPTSRIDDETLARIIHNDEIDILLDLNGDRESMNRPGLPARKPAGLHILAFGEPETAHIWGYDAVLTDTWLLPLDKTTELSEQDAVWDMRAPLPCLRSRQGFLDVWNIIPENLVPEKSPSPLIRLGLSCPLYQFSTADKAFLTECLLTEKTVLIVNLDEIGEIHAFNQLCSDLDCPDELIESQVFSFQPRHKRDNFFLEIDLLLPPAPLKQIAQSFKALTPFYAIRNDPVFMKKIATSLTAQLGLENICLFDDFSALKEKIIALSDNPSLLEKTRTDIKEILTRENKMREQADKAILFFDELMVAHNQTRAKLKKGLSHDPG